jgi:hypothetical protein
MGGTKGIILQPRDLCLFRELSVLSVADHAQTMIVAGFGSISRANRRLRQLTGAGFLRRFFLGSGGGRKALYSLSERGAHVIGVPMRGLRRPQGALLAADYFIEHQLQVNSIYCKVKFEPVPVHGIAFARWIAFHESISPELKLRPDGYVEFSSPWGIDPLFLEVDLGTESLGIWKEKTRKYLDLALSGTFRGSLGHERFRVLVVVNSERRLESLRKPIRAVTEKIFRFATLDVARARFFEPVWRRPDGNQPESLFEQHP